MAPGRPLLDRRTWLTSLPLLGLCVRSTLGAESRAVATALDRAKRAGLKRVEVDRSTHYDVVGDAPRTFRLEAAALCESLADGYLDHFNAKGFVLKFPEGRLTIVALASRESYEAFKGEAAGEAEGGHYDVEADRLVMYDFRPDDGPGRGGAGNARLNTFTLVHEAIHQLTFGTGLLSRQADVPLAVSEGLATYGELWQKSRPTIGQVNRPRLAVLANPGRVDWIPLETLLARDSFFNDAETEQLAYAEAWLIIAQLLKTRAGTTKLITYLERLRIRKDDANRVGDAQECLGSLGRLDRELKQAAGRLIRG